MSHSMAEQQQAEWQELFSQLRTRLAGYVNWRRVWSRLLNEEQRRRLGGDLNHVSQYQRLVDEWATMHGIAEEQAALDLSYKLDHLTQTEYEFWTTYVSGVEQLGGSRVNEAICRMGLVLVDQSERVAYWRGDIIPITWSQHAAWWEFLWELANISQSNGWLDERCFDDSVTWKALRDRKSDLTQHENFPIRLDNAIESRREEHGYRLALAREPIELFRRNGDGRLVPFRRRG